jgi:hypothetical protein
MQDPTDATTHASGRKPWNKGKLIGDGCRAGLVREFLDASVKLREAQREARLPPPDSSR